MVARFYRVEADQAFLDELRTMRFPVSTGNASVDEGYRLLAKYLSNTWENSITELAVDYARVFIGHGVDGYSAAYPFESVYTSEKRLLMQGARDEVLALYRVAGLEKQESWREGEDHIALELEYMQILSLRTAEALREGDQDRALSLLKSQFNFMDVHLGGWAPLLTGEMRTFAKTDFYKGLAYMAEGFLETDTELLEDLLAEA